MESSWARAVPVTQATTASAAGNYLSRSPKFTANVGGNVNFDTGMGKLEFYGNAYYNDGFFFDPQNIVQQKSYVLINVGGSFNFSKNLKLRASVDNLLNEQYSNYADNGQFGGTISAASPRLFRVGVQFDF